jgi:hypothetical protein
MCCIGVAYGIGEIGKNAAYIHVAHLNDITFSRRHNQRLLGGLSHDAL